MSLVSKLAAVMAQAERVPKRGRNDFHKYDYATEADIAATIQKELASRHVMLIPSIIDEKREAIGEKGAVLTTLIMEMEFLDGESGESIKKPWRGYGTDKDDKGGYKAMTGAEKYFLLKTFLMPTGDDPERDDQKERGGYSVQPVGTTSDQPIAPKASDRVLGPPAGSGADSRRPDTAVYLERVDITPTKNNPNLMRYAVTLSTGEVVTTIKEPLGHLCQQLCQERIAVTVETKASRYGTDLVAVHRISEPQPALKPVEKVELTADDIPFTLLWPMVVPALWMLTRGLVA